MNGDFYRISIEGERYLTGIHIPNTVSGFGGELADEEWQHRRRVTGSMRDENRKATGPEAFSVREELVLAVTDRYNAQHLL